MPRAHGGKFFLMETKKVMVVMSLSKLWRWWGPDSRDFFKQSEEGVVS